MKESFDILIVGAGASGLAAAISAKRTLPRLRVAMLERLPRVGKKILATGNGRCNLIPALPGAQYILSTRELFATALHIACSLPPLPTTNTFIFASYT